MDFFVKALEIKNWAAKSEASLELPHLLRRLVCGTVTELEACDFPAYESTYKPGFDGVVRCKQGNAWVPSNVSVWEMGKDAGVATKANKDFKKRTKSNALSMEEKKETTFVFVTPREWKNKTDWAREKNKIGIWKEVRAYDATNLEQWLETTKAVTIWFGRKIGSRPLYVDDIESRWQAIANSAEHILVPELFLAGRAESQTSLSNWLDAEAGCLTVQTRSPKEVTDFFCAFVESFEADRRVELQSRTIIVENRDAWKILVDCHPANLIVEPTFELESDEITKAIANGHHVLRAVEPSTACSGNAISLERSPQFELSQFLEKSGYSPVVSQQHARAAGGSLAILKHRLAVNPSNLEPDWISEADSTIVTACLLLGGWNGLNEADRNAFAQLANRPYEEAEAKLQELANCTDPLLLNAAGCWRLISKDHAWAIFQSRISSDALNRFADLAVEILADDDPKYELPDDKRAFANIYGHTPMYSPIVKKHVAETLALLGAFGDGFAVASNTNIPATLARVVQHVLSPNATWHRWATLGIRLAMLAEASPKDFIKSVKAELSKSDSEFKKLLDDDGDDTMFSGCKHAGLLWALELLAWPKTHLLDAATSLMDLAKIDPGGRWGNRPMSSLNGILLHWIPHTTANVAERIQVLDRLIELDSEVPWRLLVSLLPQHLGHSDSAQQPYWRDWANDWVRGATRKESIEFCNAVARRVIEQADTDPDRWLKIFENVGLFPFDSRESFLSAAHRFAETQLSDENRRQVSEVLFEHIHRHRRHPNADWSIPKEILHELDKVLEKLQPKTASVRHAWLFKPYPDRFFRDGDVSKGEERLKEARANAITEIISKERFAGVLSLAEKAEAANCVGVALSETTEDKYVDALIPDLISEPDWQLDLIRGFVWNRWYPDNWDWLDQCIERCPSASEKAWLLAIVRAQPQTWERANKLGSEIEKLYWQRTGGWNLDLDAKDTEFLSNSLVNAQRLSCSFALLAMAIHQKKSVSTEALLLPLEAFLKLPADQVESQLGRNRYYDIQRVIEELQIRNDTPEDRLIRLEWNFMGLLSKYSGHAPKKLYSQLASSPEFFVEVLSCCFKSKNESKEPVGLPEAEVKRRENMASQAYRLLNDWNLLPGTNDSNEIDLDELQDWCNRARQLAEECGRLGVCDSQIGQLFAVAPRNDNGSWPEPVCQVVEGIGTDSLASGLSCGIHNSRGATFRGKGGDQERELESTFGKLADEIRFKYPFFAQALDDVAESYSRSAKWWDEQEAWEDR